MIDPLMAGQHFELRERIKERWSRVGDADLRVFGVGRDALVEVVRDRYGLSGGAAAREVDEFFDRLSGLRA